MNTPRPITEDDLHAYVDHALNAGRRAEVEAWLSANPDSAGRVERMVAHRSMLRDALGPIAEEDVPPRLSLAALTAPRAAPPRHPWRSAAAAVLLLLAGGSVGWFGRGMTGPSNTGVANVAREAMANFDVYGTDTIHPVEFKADDRADLMGWLSARLGRRVMAPDLSGSGYEFLGGRLVATPHGPAGLFVYDNGQGGRLVMLVRPMEAEKDRPMTEHTDGSMAGFAWAQKGLGYSLVGVASPSVLHPLANEARRQIQSVI